MKITAAILITGHLTSALFIYKCGIHYDGGHACLMSCLSVTFYLRTASCNLYAIFMEIYILQISLHAYHWSDLMCNVHINVENVSLVYIHKYKLA